ncbi:MAG: type II toxin-antitoxin system VapC family toxin [Bryobacterales bacterium]|nr:type II toxin-antitoxin system VapC family toxin [Bryobacterales bacterium]
MVIPDVNILVYAYDTGAVDHPVARQWWEGILNSQTAVGLPWVSTLGFIRIVTSRRAVSNPMAVKDAVRYVRYWLDRPHVRILTPGERHAEILFGLIESLGTAGNLTTDAHLAALAMEYRAELVSMDADFARFKGLRWRRLGHH